MFKWLGCGEKTWEVQEIHIWVRAHPFLFFVLFLALFTLPRQNGGIAADTLGLPRWR